MKKLLAIVVLLQLVGCVHSQSANDGYVPWWVTDGVPNADGVIVK